MKGHEIVCLRIEIKIFALSLQHLETITGIHVVHDLGTQDLDPITTALFGTP